MPSMRRQPAKAKSTQNPEQVLPLQSRDQTRQSPTPILTLQVTPVPTGGRLDRRRPQRMARNVFQVTEKRRSMQVRSEASNRFGLPLHQQRLHFLKSMSNRRFLLISTSRKLSTFLTLVTRIFRVVGTGSGSRV